MESTVDIYEEKHYVYIDVYMYRIFKYCMP